MLTFRTLPTVTAGAEDGCSENTKEGSTRCYEVGPFSLEYQRPPITTGEGHSRGTQTLVAQTATVFGVRSGLKAGSVPAQLGKDW